jgi:hypothetical protein
VAEAVKGWIEGVGAKTAYIEKASPWENGYVESFNGKLRDELLNGEVFNTLREAQVLIEDGAGTTTGSGRTRRWVSPARPGDGAIGQVADQLWSRCGYNDPLKFCPDHPRGLVTRCRLVGSEAAEAAKAARSSSASASARREVVPGGEQQRANRARGGQPGSPFGRDEMPTRYGRSGPSRSASQSLQRCARAWVPGAPGSLLTNRAAPCQPPPL